MDKVTDALLGIVIAVGIAAILLVAALAPRDSAQRFLDEVETGTYVETVQVCVDDNWGSKNADCYAIPVTEVREYPYIQVADRVRG